MTVNGLGLIIFTAFVSLFIGYLIARIQLASKFHVAEEAIAEAESRAKAYAWKIAHPRTVTLSGPYTLQDSDLIKTPNCPDGWGAAQILGYNDFGIIHESLYPGGKEQYLQDN